MSNFSKVSADEWQFDERVSDGRRSWLTTLSFEGVSFGISKNAGCSSIYMEPVKDHPGCYRAHVDLDCPARLVDVFHSGLGGYRAQYYVSPVRGDSANRYFLATVLNQIEQWGQTQNDWPAINASIRHADAKAWIHEGTWFEDSTAKDLHLTVPRWQSNAERITIWPRFDLHWARVMPSEETIIEIKGGCVDKTGTPIDIKLKPKRSAEIHNYGFT